MPDTVTISITEPAASPVSILIDEKPRGLTGESGQDGTTPQIQDGGTGLEVSADEGTTWNPLVSYQSILDATDFPERLDQKGSLSDDNQWFGFNTFNDLDIEGSVTINSGASVGGTFTTNGNTVLGGTAGDTITLNARFASSLLPSSTNTRDVGSSALRFKDLWLSGNATAAGSLSAGSISVTGNTVLGNPANFTDGLTVRSSLGDFLMYAGRLESTRNPFYINYNRNNFDLGNGYLTITSAGATTIGGPLTVTGQTQLAAGQAATDAQSAMSRGLADSRYGQTVALHDTTGTSSASSSSWTNSTRQVTLPAGTWAYQGMIGAYTASSTAGVTIQFTALAGTGVMRTTNYRGTSFFGLTILQASYLRADSNIHLAAAHSNDPSGDKYAISSINGTIVTTTQQTFGLQITQRSTTDASNPAILMSGSYVIFRKIA
jgi:hypothetical protein